MDIAAMSMDLALLKTMQQASVSVTKKAMDVAETQMQGVVDMMQTPNFGARLNVRA